MIHLIGPENCARPGLGIRRSELWLRRASLHAVSAGVAEWTLRNSESLVLSASPWKLLIPVNCGLWFAHERRPLSTDPANPAGCCLQHHHFVGSQSRISDPRSSSAQPSARICRSAVPQVADAAVQIPQVRDDCDDGGRCSRLWVVYLALSGSGRYSQSGKTPNLRATPGRALRADRGFHECARHSYTKPLC